MPENHTAVPLLSAILNDTPAEQVVDVLTNCTPDDVRLVDAPTATILDVALDLAKSGTVPLLVVVRAELLRRGLLAGHAGELVDARLAAAASPAHYPVMLPELSASVMSIVFRAHCRAAGEALVNGADTAPESDLWEWLRHDGAKARQIRDRLTAIRGEAS